MKTYLDNDAQQEAAALDLSNRFSRHFHDLVRLEETGHLAEALAAQDVAEAVAIHKNAFFAEKDANGNRIDYVEAVHGGLTLWYPAEADTMPYGQTMCTWSRTGYWPALRRRLTI